MNTNITENITSPASAIPVATTVGIANWLGSLPEIINILTALYLIVLISHKVYVWIKEYRTKTLAEDK